MSDPSDRFRELSASGLIVDVPEVHLTDKGREWLNALEAIQQDEVVAVFGAGTPAEDLIMATSGLFR